MKEFIISISLFSLLVLTIFANSFFVIKNANDLSRAAADLPGAHSPSCEVSINSFRKDWEKFKKTARFSLSYTELSKIDCLIDELDCHRRTGNDKDYEHTRTVMQNLLSQLSRLEKPTADAIF